MIAIIPLFSALLTFGLALYTWSLRRRFSWVLTLALLLFAISYWSFGYTFELLVDSLEAKVLWAKLEYLGIVAVPFLWFVFAWQYIEQHQWLTRNYLLLFCIIPITTVVFAWTNDQHGLLWEQLTLVQVEQNTILQLSYGIWFWVNIIYSYILLLIGSVILFQAFGRFSHAYRWQMIILLLAPLAPWISNTVYILGLSPIPGLDLTPPSFAISGVIFAWGIFRLQLFDVAPIARGTLVDNLESGVLMVDLNNQGVDVNQAFLNIVGLSKKAVIGVPLNELLNIETHSNSPNQYTHRDLELNGQYYDVTISKVLNKQQHIRGTLIVLHNITERKVAEEEVLSQKKLSEVLTSVAYAATQDLDLNTAMNNTIQTVVGITRAEIGNLILIDEDWQIVQSVLIQNDGKVIVQRSSDIQNVIDTGLSGWVARNRQAVSIPDVNEDERWLTLRGRPNKARSALAVPVIEQGEVFGVISVTHRAPHHFTTQDQYYIQAAANQMSVALRNTQTHVALRQHAADLSTLFAITRLVSRSLVHENLLEQALYVAMTALKFDMGLLSLKKGDGQLSLIAERGLPQALSLRFQQNGFEGTLSDLVHKRQEGIYLPDIQKLEGELKEIEGDVITAIDDLQKVGVRSYYGIPLQNPQESLGTLSLFAKERREVASIQERALYEAIGHQMSTAIANTRLYSQINQQLKNQTLLREAVTAINSTLELNEVLTQIAQQMSRALDTTSAYICSYNSETLAPETLAGYISPEANVLEKESDFGVFHQLSEEFPDDLITLAQGHISAINVDDPELVDAQRERMLRYGIKSILIMPFNIGNQTTAYAELWESRRLRNFSGEEIGLAQIMAGQAAIAMENANLFASIANERGRLEAIIQSSRDGIVLVGMDRRILVMNEMALQLFNLPGSPQDWINRPMRDALTFLMQDTPEIVKSAINEMQRIRLGDEPAGSGEYEVNSQIIFWQNLPVLSDETALGRLLILRNVTQEKLLERMRDDLTHTMVHDLRNPLASISLSLDIMSSYLNKLDEPKIGRVINRAQESSARMLSMVNAILDISRLENGHMPIQPSLVLLPELLSAILSAQLPIAEKKNIQLEKHLPSDAKVWADKGLLERVLQNLVGNALKFTPDGGLVEVTAVQKETPNGLRWHVSVKDTGRGIPSEIKDHLFQKFTTGTQQQRGNGLGLAFCRMALEAHGEKIWVEDSSAKGTTFMFTLPCKMSS